MVALSGNMSVPFAVQNIEGWVAPGRIHLVGSGRLLVPWQANDWLRTNFALFGVMGVHFGYLVAAMRVFRELRRFISRQPRITITGHSLGGSVAEVLGVLIARATGAKVYVHNFGGPAPFHRRRWFFYAILAAKPVDCTWYHAGADVLPFAMFWNRHLGRRQHITTDTINPIENHIHGYRQFLRGTHG